jgi:dihydroorotase
MNLLIRNGRVLDTAQKLDETVDLLILDGRVARIGKGLPSSSGMRVVEAGGRLVVPGLMDVHVHFREPGYEYKETIRTGLQAAAAGGFTTVLTMPNTNPVNDQRAVTQLILDRAGSAGLGRVLPIGAITKGSLGEELTEMGELKESGCVAVSDDGRPVTDGGTMRRAMEYAKGFDLVVVDHCEDACLAAGGVMHEGPTAMDLGLCGIPSAAEEVMVARDIALAELTGCRIHIAHVSSEGSVRLIREAKSRGVPVTAEATPHHLHLTDEATLGYNTNAKMNPPLRLWRDREALREGLRDGTIGMIATDHAPHAPAEKEQEFDQAPFGVVGLETALSLTLMLVEEGALTLSQAIERLTIGPARAFGLPYGTLAVGALADVTIIDPEAAWVVDPAAFRSRSRNTPFGGWKLKGRAAMTIVGGRVIFEE